MAVDERAPLFSKDSSSADDVGNSSVCDPASNEEGSTVMPSTCGSDEGGLSFDAGSRVWAGEKRFVPCSVVLLYLRSGPAQAAEMPERIIRVLTRGSIALLMLATRVMNRVINEQR